MAVFAIGDIQGCYDSLQKLLAVLDFDRRSDRLVLVGDLVNRGPESLEVLRWAYQLGDRLSIVLGNHDLHLLAAAIGSRQMKPRDTLDDVLAAPDCMELLTWLRSQPLFHEEGEIVVIHAGLHPSWSIDDARRLAGEVETALRGDDWREVLAAIYASRKLPWSDELCGAERLRSIVNVLVRMRTCTRDGEVCKYAGPPEGAPEGCVPWFDFPARRSRDRCILFGHWATLGLRNEPSYVALDSGCVWGGQLTAMRLDDRAVFQVDACEPQIWDEADDGW